MTKPLIIIGFFALALGTFNTQACSIESSELVCNTGNYQDQGCEKLSMECEEQGKIDRCEEARCDDDRSAGFEKSSCYCGKPDSKSFSI